jgi:hypothetical protein
VSTDNTSGSTADSSNDEQQPESVHNAITLGRIQAGAVVVCIHCDTHSSFACVHLSIHFHNPSL